MIISEATMAMAETDITITTSARFEIFGETVEWVVDTKMVTIMK